MYVPKQILLAPGGCVSFKNKQKMKHVRIQATRKYLDNTRDVQLFTFPMSTLIK